jgi:hypothetical protein
MKYFNPSFLITFFFVSCGSLSKKNTATINQSTLAEISVKVGGKWEGRKYIGGTFKNVKSLKLAKEHTDHSFDIRYEGPGWESNKIGYRLYLDWRNAIDIFGKKTNKIILPQVGQDGFDSYHQMSDWGQDILKAGKGIGLGSIDRFLNKERQHFYVVDSTIAHVYNTTNSSTVKINYYGWKTADDKIDLRSELTIEKNQRHTKHSFQTSKKINGICTGIVKQKNTEVLKGISKNKKWAYIATYGQQSLIPDKLGMAIFYKVNTIENEVETDLDHLIVFKPSTNIVDFYFTAAWEQEVNGIKSKEAFEKYLEKKLSLLNDKNKI